MQRRPRTFELRTITRLLALGSLVLSADLLWGQGTGLQTSGLQYVQTISIPGWKTPGTPGNANVDVFGFNPVTRIMYLADRTNNGIDVIDTRTNVVVGLIPMPKAKSAPNVPLVAVNLQQLVVSDGLKSVWVWDLRAPQPSQPTEYVMPSTTPDAMDYDPINQVVYVVTDDPPYSLVGISLPYKKIVLSKTIPVSTDLIKWNPTDGKIYLGVEDADNNNAQAGVWSYDPVADTFALVTKDSVCPGHGIDIDPISNIAVVGCAAIPPPASGQPGVIAVNLANGSLLKTFNDVTGTDTVVFDPNNRRFYTGSGLNSANTSGCPSPKPGPFGTTYPILGVIDATGSGGAATLDGVACTGGGHVAGVDPITNTVYVPVSQYPPDSNSTTTGNAGVLVFRDPTAPAQAAVTSASATLAGTGGNTAAATLQMTLVGRRIRVTASPSNLPSGAQAAWLVVPSTVTNEWLACAVNSANNSAVCAEDLLGDPLIGATATLAVDMGQGGVAVARGTITAAAAGR